MVTLTSTFQISNVAPATKALPEVPYHQAIFERVSQPLFDQKERLKVAIASWEKAIRILVQRQETKATIASMQDDVQAMHAELSLLEINEQAVSRPIEACSRYHGRLVAKVHAHPLIAALHFAFMDHRPLCLSPDMIWLLICQGVAQHINANAEQLRSRFVQHAGRAQIVVIRDEFIKGSPENPWGEVIGEFSQCIREYIGPKHDLFMPQFSTTGPTERIAAEIVLLDAVQSYFEYVLETRCGIPSVSLEGTADDWQLLADRAMAFAEFGLDWWLTPLQQILLELVSTARGDVRESFWKSIYKFRSFSGGSAVTGWITAFFPYFNDRSNPSIEKNPWLAEGGGRLQSLLDGQWGKEDFHHGGPSPDSFPSGMARAPFLWKYFGSLIEMEFLGGFVGVAQDSTTLTLRPEIGWAIRQVSPALPNPECNSM